MRLFGFLPLCFKMFEKKLGNWSRLFRTLTLISIFSYISCTYRYYSYYFPFGTGDVLVSTFHGHGGSLLPHRKWIMECRDGEALIGIQDFNDDFEKLQFVWCRFMFPLKPPTEGRYPYFPSCHVRDFGLANQYFCYVPQNSSMTVNTFMTGLWDNEFQYWVYRLGTGFNGDNTQPFKCCKTPPGYYIDYISCYYMPTHDNYLEFYDSFAHFIVQCSTGYVMTGISRKANPYTAEFHIDWIQCCRVGFGRPVYHAPPVTYSNDYGGRAAFSASAIGGPQTAPVVPAAYQHQYQTLTSRSLDKTNRTTRSTKESDVEHRCDELDSFRFAGRGVPTLLRPIQQNSISS